MEIQTSIEQVAGILVRAGLRFQTHADKQSYRLLFERDAVYVHFTGCADRVLVEVTSPVLQGLDPQDAGYAVVLNRLNALNRETALVKFFLDKDKLIAGVDLVGDALRACELRSAVDAVATAAADAGDELEDASGGLRHADTEPQPVEDELP